MAPMHLPDWCRRLWPYLGRRQAETDLQEELRLHLELERERLQDAGVPEAEASRAARRKLGNALLIRERTRDVWGWRWLDDLGRDVRHALRGLGRSPGFTAIVMCVLALGVGANTAMFSIVYGVMLRPLPYPDSEAIVHIGESFGGVRRGLGRPAMPLLREEAESFEQLAAYGTRDVEWAGPDGAVTLRGATVSPSLFPVLRATPHVGRLFAEDDGEAGAEGVVLLSHRAWAARFASDPDVVGTVLALDGAPHSVIGVLAEGFHFPSPDEEIWTPEAIAPVPRPSRLRETVGRLRRMNARLWAAVVQPRFYAVFAGGLAALALFLAAFGVYGLLSHAVSQRRREIGVRMALGAQRGDIVALVVRQGAALVTAGALLGIVAAAASSRVLESFLYGVASDDRLTLVGAPLVLVAAAVAACWLPARRATRIDPVQALRVE